MLLVEGVDNLVDINSASIPTEVDLSPEYTFHIQLLCSLCSCKLPPIGSGPRSERGPEQLTLTMRTCFACRMWRRRHSLQCHYYRVDVLVGPAIMALYVVSVASEARASTSIPTAQTSMDATEGLSVRHVHGTMSKIVELFSQNLRSDLQSGQAAGILPSNLVSAPGTDGENSLANPVNGCDFRDMSLLLTDLVGRWCCQRRRSRGTDGIRARP